MVRGLYTAWTGMAAEQKRLDIISNNLANASTIAYKKDGITNQTFADVYTMKIKDQTESHPIKNIGSMSLGVKLGETYTDYNQGSLRETGNSLDLAIEGYGFFAINRIDDNGNSEICYTRAGSFIQDQEGNVVDEHGNSLLGRNGAITIPVGTSELAVSTDGYLYADGMIIDQVMIQDFEDYQSLEKLGDSMYRALDNSVLRQSNSMIHQGFIEQSNVNVVSEMVQMIAITRAYEANQKAIKTIDGTLDLAANSIGRI